MLLHVYASFSFRDCHIGCGYIYASQVFVIPERNINSEFFVCFVGVLEDYDLLVNFM